MRKEKSLVRNFYDSFGWRRGATGRYHDTEQFVDTRPITGWYWRRIHPRVSRWFDRGRFFLDAGCGPLQEWDLADSAGYTHRVCVDISETALREARERLGNRGFCVLADLAQLPFRDGVFDAEYCAHALYHVPADEQGTVLQEFHRTLRAPGTCLIVYSQTVGLSRILRLGRPIKRLIRFLRHRRASSPSDSSASASKQRPPLYFHAHGPRWFRDTLPKAWDVDVRCWSMMDQTFLEQCVPNNSVGRCMLALIYLIERLFPHVLAWVGYQTIIIRKHRAEKAADSLARS